MRLFKPSKLLWGLPLALLALTAGPAHAHGVQWGVSVGSPGVAVGVGSGPVYVAPPPVYVPPPPVYVAPPPVYVPPRRVMHVQPDPVYVVPAPPVVYEHRYYPPGGYYSAPPVPTPYYDGFGWRSAPAKKK